MQLAPGAGHGKLRGKLQRDAPAGAQHIHGRHAQAHVPLDAALLKALKVLRTARVCDLPGVHQGRNGQALGLLGLRLQGVVQGLGYLKRTGTALAQGLGLLGRIAHLGGQAAGLLGGALRLGGHGLGLLHHVAHLCAGAGGILHNGG